MKSWEMKEDGGELRSYEVRNWGCLPFGIVRGELRNWRDTVKHSRMPRGGERGQAVHPTGGESTGEGFALGGRWADSPIVTGRVKQSDH